MGETRRRVVSKSTRHKKAAPEGVALDWLLLQLAMVLASVGACYDSLVSNACVRAYYDSLVSDADPTVPMNLRRSVL